MPTTTPETLTLDELAARWKVARRTLDYWRMTGQPMPREARWLGQRPIRFLLSDVEAFEKTHR